MIGVLLNNEVERMWNWLWPSVRYYPCFYRDRQRKSAKKEKPFMRKVNFPPDILTGDYTNVGSKDYLSRQFCFIIVVKALCYKPDGHGFDTR
jgi:hypothetical protein